MNASELEFLVEVLGAALADLKLANGAILRIDPPGVPDAAVVVVDSRSAIVLVEAALKRVRCSLDRIDADSTVAATVLDADWLNMVQEDMARAIEGLLAPKLSLRRVIAERVRKGVSRLLRRF